MTKLTLAFVPTGKTVDQRMEEFTALGRRVALSAFPLINFDAPVWDVTEYCEGARNIKTSLYLIRNEYAAARGKHNRPILPMDQPFCNFAKAYLLYIQQFKPRIDFGKTARLPALQTLEKALREITGRSNIQELTPFICDSASELLEARLSQNIAYSAGVWIELIVSFVSENRLVSTPFQWKNKIPAPLRNMKRRTSQAGQEAFVADIPTPHEQDAICEVFFNATHPQDVMPASTCILLWSAPMRINEPLKLRARFEDCFVEEKEGEEMRLWWRDFPGSKYAPDADKQIPLNLAPFVRLAFEKIRTITEPARILAKWYEDHPGQMYLPDGLEHLREKECLTGEDVQRILNLATPRMGIQYLHYHNLRSQCFLLDSVLQIPFEAFERHILSRLPKGFQNLKKGEFPYKNRARKLKFSEALFVIRQGELVESHITNPVLFQEYTLPQIAHALGVHSHAHSMFQRHAPPLTEPDGSKIRLRTHQFRALLITEGLKGRAAFASMRRWAMQANANHTGEYFRPNQDYIEAEAKNTLELAKTSPFLFGPPDQRPHRTNEPLEDWELDETLAQHCVRHRTAWGGCGRPLVVHPCQQFLDCLNCNSWFCVKGDKEANDHIRKEFVDVKIQLDEAEAELVQGSFGADRHIDWLRNRHLRLKELVAVLDDPKIPQGTVIVLRPIQESSLLEMAIRDRLDQLGIQTMKTLSLSEVAADEEGHNDGRAS